MRPIPEFGDHALVGSGAVLFHRWRSQLGSAWPGGGRRLFRQFRCRSFVHSGQRLVRGLIPPSSSPLDEGKDIKCLERQQDIRRLSAVTRVAGSRRFWPRPPWAMRPARSLQGGFPIADWPWVRSQNIHPPGCVEGPGAALSITPGVQPFGARHGRGELRLQTIFFLVDRSHRRLTVELRRGGLTRHQSRHWISRRGADGRFELRNRSGAGTGMGKGRTQTENRTNRKSRHCSTSGHTSPAVYSHGAV
jgi:hypothetical protein